MRDTPTGPRAARNLVVCCDGTGNPWTRDRRRTNVVKLVDALVHDPARQIYLYDPGVGTADEALRGADTEGPGPSARVARLAALAWGRGVWTNVAEAYRFLMQQHRPGDRMYLFGFSRGAFTARAVAGMVHLFGVLRPETETLLPTLLSVYRSSAGPARNGRAKSLKERFANAPGDTRVEFVGVWDTVESVGLSELFFGQRISSPPTMKSSFGHVRHALALDETRRPYTPRLYSEGPTPAPGQSLEQVWFAGAHSDVGGGYAADGLSNASLHWMIREANAHGLLVDFDRLDGHRASPFALLHDQAVAMPLWSLAGLRRRQGRFAPAVAHESVRARAASASMAYGVEGLATSRFVATRDEVIEPDGRVRTRPVPASDAEARPPEARLRWGHAGAGLAAAAAAAAFAAWAGPDAVELARRQATGGGPFGLGRALADWRPTGGIAVPGLLWIDLGMIVSYTVLIAVLNVAVMRLAGRRVLGSGPSRLLAAGGGLLPVADLLENVSSRLALGLEGDVSPFFWRWLVEGARGLASVLAHVASFGKIGLAVVYVATLSLVVLRGLAPSRLVSPDS